MMAVTKSELCSACFGEVRTAFVWLSEMTS